MAFGKHWTRSECLMSDGYQLFYPLAKLPSPNYLIHLGLWLPWCSVVENLPSSPRDAGSIPGSGRSPGEGNGHPLQYFCLENPTDRGARWAAVHGVANNWTSLSDKTTTTIWTSGILVCKIVI